MQHLSDRTVSGHSKMPVFQDVPRSLQMIVYKLLFLQML